MDERAWNRLFREIRSLTTEQFKSEMNVMHSRAHSISTEQMFTALSCHPKVYKPMIKEIFDKFNEIRGKWDGITEKVTETIPYQYRTTDMIINGLNPTESEILQIESEQEITIKGKRYLIKPI